MPQVTLSICASADQVKAALGSLFCEAFQCSPAQLESKTHTQTYGVGQTMTQRVQRKGPDLILTTVKEHDTVTTTYTVLAIEAQTCTIGLSETAQSSVKTRQLNYTFFSLPLIDLIAKKRLKRRLRVLKVRIETEKVSC